MRVQPCNKAVFQRLRRDFGHPARVAERTLAPPGLHLLHSGLHEIVAETQAHHAAAFGFALSTAHSIAAPQRRTMGVFTTVDALQERGALHGAGLAQLGIPLGCMFSVTAASQQQLLWAAEEAASCAALGAAVIVLGLRDRLYGLTASRRLKLRLETSAVPVFVVRQPSGEATTALARWHVTALPGKGESVPGAAIPLPGLPRLRVRLERYGASPSQQWDIDLHATADVRLAATLSDRPAGTPARQRHKAA